MNRQVLFTRPRGIRPNIAVSAYDVSLDGRQFLMVRSQGENIAGLTVTASAGERLVLVEHWIEELKARVPR